MSDRQLPFPPALLMTPAVVAIVYFSAQIILGTTGVIPGIHTAVLVVLICLWVVGLPILLVKPLNVAVLRLAGAGVPSEPEHARLEPAWRDVLSRAGVAPNRYELVVVGSGLPVDLDLGWHVVTVDSRTIRLLDREELSGILAQRLARQTGWVAPLLGLCAWLALPLVLFLGICSLLAFFAYAIARGAGAAAKDNLPKDEGQLGCWLLVLVLGFVALALTLAIGLTVLLYLVVAMVIVVGTAWLARNADLAADAVAMGWGYRAPMVAALTKLDADQDEPTGWLRLVSTTAGPQAHLRRCSR